MIGWLGSGNWRRPAVIALVVLALAGGLAWVVKEWLEPEEAENQSGLGPPSRMVIKDGVVTLTVSEVERRNSGIETAHPGPPPERQSITAYGKVLDTAPLIELSNQYLEAAAQVQTANARLAVSRAAFERARILNKDQQNISTAQLQSAEGGFEADKAALAAARAHLATVAAGVDQGWGSVLGAAVVERQPLLTRLTERAEYLVKVTLPGGATLPAPPETATAILPDGGEVGLDFVSPATAVDPRLQGAAYVYRAAAEGGLLPGRSLEVALSTKAQPGGVVIPDAAVVWLQGTAWIYLRTAPDTFIRREVAPRHAGPAGGYLVSGVSPDAEIVVRGAQMLLSEEFRAQVPVED